jgi:hypothetical protein
MAIVREGCTTVEQRSFVRFLRVRGLTAKDIHKEIFHIYYGKCVKRFTTGSRNYLKDVSKVANDARSDAEVAEKTVKRQLRCGFRRTGKAMGQVYRCW